MTKGSESPQNSAIIANLLIVAVAFLLGSEAYTLMLHINGISHGPWVVFLQIITIAFILLLAIILRKSEITLIKRVDAQKEQIYKETINNISEKLADEETLLKEYKEAIDESAIVSKTDINGTITYVNEKFCEVTGYTKDELIGQTHKILRHPGTDRELFHNMWLTILSKKTFKGLIQNRNKRGETFFVEATISPILDANGDIKEFIAIMFDITKEMELEKKIQEESYREELNRAKESYLLVFTHELKTPLNAIINFSSFVAKKLEKSNINDKERLLELISSVKQNGEDMLFSVTNMLDTAKLTSKKMVFANSVFELGLLLQDIPNKILPPTGIKYESDIEENVFVYCDRLRVEQIVSNIISNAVKYGNGEIYLSLRSNGERFMLCIEDNGVGIKNKEHVFELFGSDASDMTRSTRGTGIGLYFAKMLCDEFGYTITITDASKLTGSRFCVEGSTIKVESL